jgi:hypothetical protein
MIRTSDPYFLDLFDRSAKALPVEPHPEMSNGDPRFLPNRCHKNAEEWCGADPTFEVIRGWLIGRQAPGAAFFEAHSIVRSRSDPSIQYDVTPIRASGLVFVEHAGEEATFASWSRSPQYVFFDPR